MLWGYTRVQKASEHGFVDIVYTLIDLKWDLVRFAGFEPLSKSPTVPLGRNSRSVGALQVGLLDYVCV